MSEGVLSSDHNNTAAEDGQTSRRGTDISVSDVKAFIGFCMAFVLGVFVSFCLLSFFDRIYDDDYLLSVECGATDLVGRKVSCDSFVTDIRKFAYVSDVSIDREEVDSLTRKNVRLKLAVSASPEELVSFRSLMSVKRYSFRSLNRH